MTEQEDNNFELWREEFIKRAGFLYTWENLESWARTMVEQAYVEQRQTQQEEVFDEPYSCFTCGSKVEDHNCATYLSKSVDKQAEEIKALREFALEAASAGYIEIDRYAKKHGLLDENGQPTALLTGKRK